MTNQCSHFLSRAEVGLPRWLKIPSELIVSDYKGGSPGRVVGAGDICIVRVNTYTGGTTHWRVLCICLNIAKQGRGGCRAAGK